MADHEERLPAGDPCSSIEAAMSRLRDLPRTMLLDMVREDQADRWRRGKRVPAEEYLCRLPELAATKEESLVLICGEMLLRRQLGDSPSLDEYRARFPEFADRLGLQFAVDEMLDGPLELQSTTSAPDEADLFSLPGYEVIRELARGASGVVHLARQQALNRLVAIKVLTATANDGKQLARQRKEAEVLGHLQHPHVVQIFEVVRHQGRLCLVMEYVEGLTLRERIQGTSVPSTEAARLVRTLAETIDAVHQAGVLHRDLKPSNVLIAAGGTAKITDFGLAKLESSDSSATTEDSILGTPSYMAPEQARGETGRIGRASDVYSLGAILYELITGRAPFLGATVLETLSLVCNRDPVPPRQLQPNIPRDLETICLKCLAKSPAGRYATAAAMADDLGRFLSNRPILARPAPWHEVAVRWCRRNPAVARLTALLVLVGLTGFVAVVWKWRDAEHARAGERIARQEADARTVEVEQGLSRLKGATALSDTARMHLYMRRWDDADRALRQTIALFPEYSRAWEERGQLYARFGLWDLAGSDLKRAFDLDQPRMAASWRSLALAHLHAHDLAGYQRVCQRMQEQFGDTIDIDLRCELVRTLSLANDPQRQFHDWIARQDALVASASRDPCLLYVSGLAYCRSGHSQQAIDHCRASLHSVPAWPAQGLNYPVLAIACSELGQSDEAHAALRSAEEAHETWIEQRYAGGGGAWIMDFGAGDSWTLNGWEWLEFQVLLREARSRLGLPPDVDDGRLHALRARALAALRYFSEAEAEYELASSLRPDDPQIHLEQFRVRAYQHVRRKDWTSAATAFASAVSLDPDDTDLCRFHAITLLGIGNVGAYRRVCGEMLERFGNTDNLERAHDVAYACVLYPDALADMNSLVPIARLGAAAYFDGAGILAAAHYRAGQCSEAVEQFEHAARVGPLRASESCFLSMALARLGRTAQARESLAAARNWIREAELERPDFNSATTPGWGTWHERQDTLRLIEEAEQLLDRHPVKQPFAE